MLPLSPRGAMMPCHALSPEKRTNATNKRSQQTQPKDTRLCGRMRDVRCTDTTRGGKVVSWKDPFGIVYYPQQ